MSDTAGRLTDVASEVDAWAFALGKELDERGENLHNGSPADSDSRFAYERMGAAGIIGLGWPRDLGGREMDPVDVVKIEERLGYHWLPLCGYLLSVKTIGNTIMKFGTPDLIARFIPDATAGRIMFCQGFSEPEAGSDLASLRTRAVKQGDQWVVNGHKIWTSSAEIADWMYLAVRTDPALPRHKGLSVMLLDMHAPGVHVDVHHTLGGGTFGEVLLSDVDVSADNILGEVNGGWTVLMGSLDFERVTSEKVGVALWVLDQLDEVAERTHRRSLLALRGELEACRRLGHEATRLIANGDRVSRVSSMCKLSVSLAMQKAAALIVEILGPQALVERGPAVRAAGRLAAFHRSSVSMTLAGGSCDIQRKVIAQQGLGLPR
ncbi:acyl-CoA dehydrogenase family protein [Amycolatopsis sp. H20-H5]|uniref:acyl-CoA dehydrogenase family protein n=1 Tax=Amycolatopsis sp. H20-H5 TaxID=3046309 RepID=UPI002DBDC61E|nr:acyl-CoA dehydrogenase family protein [Amycolatopsis sp. H20-H5]MEC3979054.1 acyl-CoA dehydrogenase family protein [Amycolatopsis sp. H20-H5]